MQCSAGLGDRFYGQQPSEYTAVNVVFLFLGYAQLFLFDFLYFFSAVITLLHRCNLLCLCTRLIGYPKTPRVSSLP